MLTRELLRKQSRQSRSQHSICWVWIQLDGTFYRIKATFWWFTLSIDFWDYKWLISHVLAFSLLLGFHLISKMAIHVVLLQAGRGAEHRVCHSQPDLQRLRQLHLQECEQRDVGWHDKEGGEHRRTHQQKFLKGAWTSSLVVSNISQDVEKSGQVLAVGQVTVAQLASGQQWGAINQKWMNQDPGTSLRRLLVENTIMNFK